jgi:transposase
MDWVLERQPRIEKKLAARHLSEGSLVLYDLTSIRYTGKRCPLARLGRQDREGRKRFLQIAFGLLCNVDGCPVAVEVFEGNVSDAKTVASQVDKVCKHFGIRRIVVVGDRGIITDAVIRENLATAKTLSWIGALRAPAIRALVEKGSVQLSLFDETDLAEVSFPDFPGERLVVCRNPLLAAERARVREELLKATEKELDKITLATQRAKRRLHGKDKIGVRVGKVINSHKVAKHFSLTIAESGFSYARNHAKIAEETAVDGIYVIRTNVRKRDLGPEDTVRAYKDLSTVERAFRCMKTVDLKVRPVPVHAPSESPVQSGCQ